MKKRGFIVGDQGSVDGGIGVKEGGDEAELEDEREAVERVEPGLQLAASLLDEFGVLVVEPLFGRKVLEHLVLGLDELALEAALEVPELREALDEGNLDVVGPAVVQLDYVGGEGLCGVVALGDGHDVGDLKADDGRGRVAGAVECRRAQ